MNNEKYKRRIIAIAFCVCIISVAILSNVFILSHSEHNHDNNGVGGGCVTCELLLSAENIGKQLGVALVGVLLAMGKMFFDVKTLKTMVACVLPTTPVRLKIRMNN